MKYNLKFFTHYHGEEQLIASYAFDSMPLIPKKKDLVSFEDGQYNVKKVAICYEGIENNEILIEVMLDDIDYDKEWWE